MFASVRLVIREENAALVVPRSAIKDYNGSDIVYVIENGLARRTNVTLGLSNDAEVQITSGVTAGERVITAGAVTDSSPVRVAGE
jgi:membrane fusion protein (multidrug efflux system)